MNQRPSDFRMDYQAPLARGLVFAGLGRHPKSKLYTDSSLFKNAGLLTNMTPADDWQWSAELGRWVLDFDGSDDYVTVPSNATSLNITGAITCAAWIDLTDTRTYREIFGCKSNASPYPGCSLSGGAGTAGIPSWRVDVASGYWTSATTNIRATGWRHLAVTDDRAGWITFYIDGRVDVARNITTTETAYNGTRTIGSRSDGAFAVLARLADPLIYSRALTPAEIEQLADPSNVMLSGLILPPRRRVWPSPVVPLALPDYADVTNESPFEQDEAIVTVAASGGSTPYSYSLTAQSTTVGMLKVTGTLNPDATGVYVENGTYNGEPAYERADGNWWIWYQSGAWQISDGLGYEATTYGWVQENDLLGSSYVAFYSETGTPTVALYAPFAINASTGEITITDPSGLAVGQTWTITVQVTDALTDTDTGTVTVELTAASVIEQLIADSLGITDAAARVVAYVRLRNESLGVTDTATRLASFVRAVAESEGITDNATRAAAFARATDDAMGLTDATARAVAFARVIDDAEGTLDALVRIVEYARTTSETVGIADAVVKAVIFARAVADSQGLTDDVAAGLFRMLSQLIGESMGLTDTTDRIVAYARELADDEAVADEIDRTVAYLRELIDNQNLTDAATKATAFGKFISETLGLSDSMELEVVITFLAAWYVARRRNREEA